MSDRCVCGKDKCSAAVFRDMIGAGGSVGLEVRHAWVPYNMRAASLVAISLPLPSRQWVTFVLSGHCGHEWRAALAYVGSMHLRDAPDPIPECLAGARTYYTSHPVPENVLVSVRAQEEARVADAAQHHSRLRSLEQLVEDSK